MTLSFELNGDTVLEETSIQEIITWIKDKGITTLQSEDEELTVESFVQRLAETGDAVAFYNSELCRRGDDYFTLEIYGS